MGKLIRLKSFPSASGFIDMEFGISKKMEDEINDRIISELEIDFDTFSNIDIIRKLASLLKIGDVYWCRNDRIFGVRVTTMPMNGYMNGISSIIDGVITKKRNKKKL